MIDVLVPSRGRPEMLVRSLHSLFTTAADPRSVRCHVAVDNDDRATEDVVRYLAGSLEPGAVTLTVSERHGYAGLHHYYNTLAMRGSGDWLLLWNDDAFMQTTTWDMALDVHMPAGVLVADLQSAHSPGLCCFPAVRREAVEALGFFATDNPHCDTLWQDIGRATGTIAAVPVHVLHDRPDLTGRAPDATWTEGRAGTHGADYGGSPHQAQVLHAIATIRKAFPCAL